MPTHDRLNRINELMPQITLDERRLQTLRRQLFGNQEPPQKTGHKIQADTSKELSLSLDQISSKPQTLNTQNITLDSNYLGKDLFKILILTVFALALQLLLYLGANKGLITFFG